MPLLHKLPILHEATEAEETEEFSLLADVFAPHFDKRVPGKRVHLTSAHKKKVNKASIGLPDPRTLKLFTYNNRPFILKHPSPLEEFREKYSRQLINTGINPELDTIFEDRQLEIHSAPAVSIPDQKTFAALPDLAPGPSEYLQNHQTSKDLASSVTVDSRPNNVKPEILVRVNSWLDQINVPTGAESESPNPFSDLVDDEEVWDLIERIVRQRKSPLRQMPNTMLTETTNTSVRGSDGSRPSVNYPRPSESNSRTVTNTIKDYPGPSARRPKNMPSGSQLPSCWNDEMDEFICHMEAQCEFSTKSIVRALKHRFAQLREVSPRFFSTKLL